MTNLERLNKMSADDMTKFIMRLIRDGEYYDYHCGNCPVTDCGNFEPEERCCWGTIMTWLGEEAD
jgi:hypothetical protein